MKITQHDNCFINLSDGHKYADCDIKKGEAVIKYGYSIGTASKDIKKGEHIHTHNLKTGLSDKISYEYKPEFYTLPHYGKASFSGYLRTNGEVGIRNEIWIINTVGCVNKTAEKIAERTGAYNFPHPFGCSQLGDDMAVTQSVLKGLINHPNAAGVLVLGLGCENNNISEMKKVLGDYDGDRVKFLNCQDVTDDIEEGVKLIRELEVYRDSFAPTQVDISRLKVGLKCGGSDGLSGITANPLVGRVSDALISMGASTVLTEVPEMFGAEQLLMQRAENEEIFKKTVALINDFKDYYKRHGQVIYENPSPGNKAGGITTLEEKSLGCVQKGGNAKVVDVLSYGDAVKKNGLSLLNGPGNDIVAVTNLTAAGAHMILFTTGRGTPLGAPVPTVKISTNTELFKKKPEWIDFDAGQIIEGKELTGELLDYVLRVASGEKTKNEKNGYREISIFKEGVTL